MMSTTAKGTQTRKAARTNGPKRPVPIARNSRPRTNARSRKSSASSSVAASLADMHGKNMGELDALRAQVADMSEALEANKDTTAAPLPVEEGSVMVDLRSALSGSIKDNETSSLSRTSSVTSAPSYSAGSATPVPDESGRSAPEHTVVQIDPWELVEEELLLDFTAKGVSLDSLTKITGRARNMLDRRKLSSTPGYYNKVVDLVQKSYKNAREVITWDILFHTWWKHNGWMLVLAVLCSLVVSLGACVYFSGARRTAYRIMLVTSAIWLITCSLRFLFCRTRGRTIITYGGIVNDHCAQLGPLQRKDLIDNLQSKFTAPTEDKCRTRRTRVGFTIGLDHLWLPRGCHHNEERALLTRQLLPPVSEPFLRSATWSRSLECFKVIMSEDYKSEKWFSYEAAGEEEAHAAYLLHAGGKQRSRYIAGKLSIERGERVVCDTAGFVKREWLNGRVNGKHDPRFISSKSPEYFAATAPGYYDFQKAICKKYWSGSYDELVKNHFLYPGGIDRVELGKLVSHFETLGWYVYEGDFSRYDGHTESEALWTEFQLYREAGMPERLLHEIKKQAKTKGTTSAGRASFRCSAKRASGVINTTIGNTLCGMVLFAGCLTGRDWFLVQMGDDNIIFSRDRLDVREIVDHCRRGGHKLEMVERGNLKESYDDLEFCSSVFWDVGEHRVLSHKPFRALAKSLMPTEMLTPSNLMKHVAGVALGYQHDFFVPVLGEVCQRILRANAPGKVHGGLNPYRLTIRQAFEVDQNALEAHFEHRYGVSPAQVLETLGGYDFSKPGSVYHPLLEDCMQIDGFLSESSVMDLCTMEELA